MGISVSVVSSNIALWNYIDKPYFFIDKYIGEIGETFYSKPRNIKNKMIKQFLYIYINVNTIFNSKQVEQLKKEVKILKKERLLCKEDLKVLNNGIQMILENKTLYLKFEYE